jgi:hypothetical protein
MVSSYLSRRTISFVVRLWVEYLDQTPPVWRGEIEFIGSRQVTHFGNLNEMSEQIQRCVEAQNQIRNKDLRPQTAEHQQGGGMQEDKLNE